MQLEIKYQIYRCKNHKKTIHYFENSRVGQETLCWDCIREANNRKLREEKERTRAREQFAAEFSHLWVPNTLGGIASVTVERDGLHVAIESSSEAFSQIPNVYLKYQVHKQITGEAA